MIRRPRETRFPGTVRVSVTEACEAGAGAIALDVLDRHLGGELDRLRKRAKTAGAAGISAASEAVA